jgi:hypothetical protein
MTPRPTSTPRTPDGAVVGRPTPGTRKRLWRIVFGVALGVQLIVVYAPDGPAGPGIVGLDKVIHVSIFAVPALAALMVGWRARWWAVGILAVHAPISELVQHFFLPHRDGDVLDVMADLGGIALGSLAYLVWTRRQH